jgi:hypothetical protein
MPYIVTTRERHPSYVDSSAPFGRVLSRRAVATLDEAHDCAALVGLGAMANDPPDSRLLRQTIMLRITEQGGTIGPLPDGTVIEVERATWADLRRAVGREPSAMPSNPKVRATTIDAYNAAQAVTA